jgi:glutamine synthetase
VPDLTGVARGKILPREKFTEDRGMRLPEVVVALAATLACGLLGIEQRIEPTRECTGDAYQSARELPRSLSEAIAQLRAEQDLAAVLGKEFLTVYAEIKDLEHEEFMRVISPWEREHLLLHV